MNGGRDGGASADPALVRYLEANQGNATFLVATPNSMTADGIILTTNKPVMALGGFGGGDPILTTNQLVNLITRGAVRFFLLSSPRARQQLPPQFLENIPEQYRDLFRGGFRGPQSSLTTWVTQHCTVVPTSLWQSPSSNIGNTFGPFGANQLYDCATRH